MKLQTKLLLGFGSLWAVFLLATVIALLLLKRQSASLEDTFISNFDSVDDCAQMTGALETLNQLAMTSVWNHNSPSGDVIAAASKRFEAGADGQKHNITLPGEAELTATAFDRAAEFRESFGRFMAASDSQRPGVYQAELLPRFTAARDAIQAVNDLNFTHLRTINGSLQKNLSQARTAQILFAGVGAASAIASLLVLTKTILGPLRHVTESARQVEAGNLDLTVPIRAMDELGELAVAFNSMAARLREYRQLDQSRLRRTQQTTQLAIDSLPDAVAVLNAQGEVEISNTQARIHFGLVPESPEPHDTRRLPDWLRELVSGPLATGTPVEPQGYQSAVQLFDKGAERFLLPRAVPMFSEAGAVIGVVVTLVDVTRLRRADEIKSSLVSTVSHELKTPLAAARFSAHLLLQESVAPLDERQRRLVKAACEGTDRLYRIIEDLLQFQRFEEGRQSVSMTSAPPEQIVTRATGELRDEFTQRGIELAIDIAPNLPQVTADPDLVNHVLTNLLSNTLKFVPTGGHVRVSARLDAGKVRFAVSDDGPGIPAEHIPRLFSRFYRAAAPAGTPGAGLGLSIARQLIEAQQGTIGYLPSAAGGAEFSFVLNVTV